MVKRKIQLVAGSTYTISLPKLWVQKNKLKEKDELELVEQNDQTLVLSPDKIVKGNLQSIRLSLDTYADHINQVLFAVYYVGVEDIQLFAKNTIDKSLRAQIRKTLTHMSGTEIVHETSKSINIHVLLDTSRLNVVQVLYRVVLILDASIQQLLHDVDMKEIRLNENEIDRLYHLLAKLVSLSLIDANLLRSSQIQHVSLIPSYFLLSKRLEHVGDNLNHLSKYLSKRKTNVHSCTSVLQFVRDELHRSINHLLSKNTGLFTKITYHKKKELKKQIQALADDVVRSFLRDLVRYLVDIEDEIMNISFYHHLIRENAL